MEILIGYLIILGIRTTMAVGAMPPSVPFLKVMLVCALFPIELLVMLISMLYRLLGVGVYFECSILMTEEDFDKLSDEIDSEEQDDE